MTDPALPSPRSIHDAGLSLAPSGRAPAACPTGPATARAQRTWEGLVLPTDRSVYVLLGQAFLH